MPHWNTGLVTKRRSTSIDNLPCAPQPLMQICAPENCVEWKVRDTHGSEMASSDGLLLDAEGSDGLTDASALADLTPP